MEKSENSLKALREELGCTQEELATMLGVTKATISRYEAENGQKPQGDTAKKVEQLQSLLEKVDDRVKVLEMFRTGGAAALAGLLAIGAASGLGRGVSLLGLCALPGVAALSGIASALFSKKLD